MHQDRTVILTRESADNRVVLDWLRRAGLHGIDYPCLETRFIPVALDEWRTLARQADVIAFTSKRAAAAVQHLQGEMTEMEQLTAVVGPATANAVQKLTGREPDIVPERFTGEALARALVREKQRLQRMNATIQKPITLLHLRGAKVNPVFKAILQDSGFRVIERVVYETASPHPKPLDIPPGSIGVFGSPMTAEHFFSVNQPAAGSFTCIAMGPVTGEYLRRNTPYRVMETAEPSSQAIISLIQRIRQGGK